MFLSSVYSALDLDPTAPAVLLATVENQNTTVFASPAPGGRSERGANVGWGGQLLRMCCRPVDPSCQGILCGPSCAYRRAEVAWYGVCIRSVYRFVGRFVCHSVNRSARLRACLTAKEEGHHDKRWEGWPREGGKGWKACVSLSRSRYVVGCRYVAELSISEYFRLPVGLTAQQRMGGDD